MKKTIVIKPRGHRPSTIIEIGPGCFLQAGSAFLKHSAGARVFIITDSQVGRLYGKQLLARLLADNVDAWLLDFPPGEQSKNDDVVRSLHTQLLANGVRRDSTIIALGGGVVGDVAGYVAATILRGIRYVQVPTTLLSQADSSVGGKVGIDHPLGKNLIGAFYPPATVHIDPLVLHTLPEREFRAGMGEITKIAAALDKSFFRFLEKHVAGINARDTRVLTELIIRSVGLKAAVVDQDEHESGLRKTLNLGHTIGHALETASNYGLRHGEAVAMGLVAESRIARDMGLLSTRDFARLLHLMDKLHLRIDFPRVKNRERFLSALSADKKSVGSSVRFVLLKSIGCTVVGVDVPSAFITTILKDVR